MDKLSPNELFFNLKIVHDRNTNIIILCKNMSLNIVLELLHSVHNGSSMMTLEKRYSRSSPIVYTHKFFFLHLRVEGLVVGVECIYFTSPATE